ncbi:MAG: hypothetical protein R3212_11355 [Xanthomonadales bacterium]|nr:hypothetical protein [Xanthomonadales bacterium]
MPGDDKLLSSLPREILPPEELEDEVVNALAERGLLGGPARKQPFRWGIPLAAAASVGLLVLGALIGRATAPADFLEGTVTGTDNNVYALLLFENPGYDAPEGPELMARYGEYNRWVATAYQRQQFLAGEDLEASEGWLIGPSESGPVIEPGVALEHGAPLSGVFFIRADHPEQALELASALPHLNHGGKVVVQRTVPTVSPPE